MHRLELAIQLRSFANHLTIGLSLKHQLFRRFIYPAYDYPQSTPAMIPALTNPPHGGFTLTLPTVKHPQIPLQSTITL